MPQTNLFGEKFVELSTSSDEVSDIFAFFKVGVSYGYGDEMELWQEKGYREGINFLHIMTRVKEESKKIDGNYYLFAGYTDQMKTMENFVEENPNCNQPIDIFFMPNKREKFNNKWKDNIKIWKNRGKKPSYDSSFLVKELSPKRYTRLDRKVFGSKIIPKPIQLWGGYEDEDYYVLVINELTHLYHYDYCKVTFTGAEHVNTGNSVQNNVNYRTIFGLFQKNESEPSDKDPVRSIVMQAKIVPPYYAIALP